MGQQVHMQACDTRRTGQLAGGDDLVAVLRARAAEQQHLDAVRAEGCEVGAREGVRARQARGDAPVRNPALQRAICDR